MLHENLVILQNHNFVAPRSCTLFSSVPLMSFWIYSSVWTRESIKRIIVSNVFFLRTKFFATFLFLYCFYVYVALQRRRFDFSCFSLTFAFVYHSKCLTLSFVRTVFSLFLIYFMFILSLKFFVNVRTFFSPT